MNSEHQPDRITPKGGLFGFNLVSRDSLATAGLLVILALLVWLSLTQIKAQILSDTASSLKTGLQSTQAEVSLYENHLSGEVGQLAQDPALISLVRQQGEAFLNQGDLSGTTALALIRSLISPKILHHDDWGMFIISPAGINLADLNNSQLGRVNPVTVAFPVGFKQVLAGTPLLSPPIRLDQAGASPAQTGDQSAYGIYILAPIKAVDGRVTAVLAVKIDPAADFKGIIRVGRVGQTDESYLFDQNGLLLTGSRFDNELAALGLLPAGQTSAGRIHLVIPASAQSNNGGGTLDVMAASAVAGNSGQDLVGYTNYRGANVFGVWTWDKIQGIGYADEVEVNEALDLFNKTRTIIFLLTFVALILSVLMAVSLNRVRKQAIDDLTHVNNTLEDRIKAHTTDLETQTVLAQNQHAQLQSVLQSTSDLIFFKDKDSIYRGCNAAFCGFHGFKEEDIINHTDRDLFPIERANDFREADLKILSDRQPVQYEEWISDKQGANYYLTTLKTPMVGLDGEVWGILGISRDITDRKITEDLLKKSEGRLRSFIEAAPDGMIVVNQDFRIVMINARCEVLFGYPRNDLVDRRVDELISGQWIDPGLFSFYSQEDFSFEEKMEDVEVLGRRKNGSEFPAEVSLGALRQEEGIWLAVSIRDISQRKRAEDQLLQLSYAVEQSPVSVVITDLRGNITYVNEKFTAVTGYTLAEALGKNPRILKSGYTSPEDYTRLWQVISSGGVWQGELQNKKKNGDLYWELANISPVTNRDGKISHYIAVKEDITERKRAEYALRQAHEELEKANVDLQNASLVKSQFLANMSHEIRTPLNAIIGMTGLLLDTPLNAEQADFAQTVRTSGDVLLTLINDILDFSKIEAQRMDLEYQAFDLTKCVEEALDLVAPRASEKKLELAYMMDWGLPAWILGDVTRLRQILVNLLTNAVKFTEAGEVIVSISGVVIDGGKYELLFAVRDTGMGIPPDRLNRLFQSFSQVDASTTRRFGGTGLGLAISKRLCELMDGSMWVESTGIPGRGSTFFFTIHTQSTQGVETPHNDAIAASLVGKRVIVVDDNQTNRQILTHQLITWDLAPTAVASGEEALALIHRGDQFDIGILDMQMPGMDGISLARAIRTERTRMQLPLLLLSSLGNREVQNDLDLFEASLTKPIKPSALYDYLCSVVNDQVAGRQKKIALSGFDPNLGKNHPLRILLAEDNVVNQKVATSLLKRIGYRADLAANGLEVLDALRRQHYDVVLMDAQMPEMDGEEATYAIRQQWPANEQPRIIAMTANVLHGDRERYLALGMDDYVAKPVSISDLSRALLASTSQDALIDGPAQAITLPDENKPGLADLVPAVQDPPQEPGLIDPEALDQYLEMMGDEGAAFVKELIVMYLSDAPKLISQLKDGLVENNDENIRRLAHTLKGNSRTIGAKALSDLCLELENRGKMAQLDGCGDLLDQIQLSFAQVENELSNSAYMK